MFIVKPLTLEQTNSFSASTKAVHGERIYCWIVIHPFYVNWLKASTDKAKQPNCTLMYVHSIYIYNISDAPIIGSAIGIGPITA